MNSKQKGSRGERALRDVWKSHGYEDAHRSQQYSGKGESSADIEGIDPRLHIECKVGYNGYSRLYQFLEQSKADAKSGEIPIVNCKMDRKPWLWVCYLDDGIEMWKDQKTNGTAMYDDKSNYIFVRRHGEWICKDRIPLDGVVYIECECSVCGEKVLFDTMKVDNFCGKCGADMRGENNE